jgi:cysteine desulfurase/selenocysteine lyase
VARFINADSDKEIIFTRNASESLNLVAYSLSEMLAREGKLSEGDEIITTVVEHHSNMLPWRLAAKRYGATVKYLECEADGSFSIDKFKALLSDRTRIVAMTAMSNIFGRVIDIKAFAAAAHEVGAYFVADGSQSVPHSNTDVQDLGVDFLAFSGHKMLAPMGIGVLYGRKRILEAMPPFLSGGEMIEYVTLEDITYAELPHKFEAGTVNACGAIGLAAAIDYIENIGLDVIEEREIAVTICPFKSEWARTPLRCLLKQLIIFFKCCANRTPGIRNQQPYQPDYKPKRHYGQTKKTVIDHVLKGR